MSFPITCTACHKTFTISDEIYGKKVSGRVVTIKCKSCGAGIRVDGLKGAGASAPAPLATAPTPAASAEAAPSEALWAVDYPDGEDREFTTAEVLAEIRRGAVERATLVWREGMAEWLEVHQVPELAGELVKVEAKKKAAEAAAAAAAAAKAAPVHKPRAPMPTVTGLAGLPVGGFKPRPAQPPPAAAPAPAPAPVQTSAPEPPKPRAQQPSAPELPKPRAQQPSTPELPKPRAQQPSTPELPKPRAQQPSAPGLPKPPPTPPPLTLPGAATAPTPPPLLPPIVEPTPPLPASVAQAQAVSRSPQPPPAFPPALANPLPTGGFVAGPAVVADSSVEWPQPKSKAPLILGIVVALLAAGGAVFLLAGKQEAPPPTTPITAIPATPTPPTAAPTAEATATTPTPTPAAAEGSETASGSDPVAAPPDPGATPGAGFAELFAAGARKAESKGASVAPSARFDAAATKAPLAEAANQAQACKQSGGPTGKVTVVVTFDPNGKAAGATITEPPFAGTGTGACITSAMKRASIPPFSGLPGTVSKTFSIL